MHIRIDADQTVTLDDPAGFTAFDILAADPAQASVLAALGPDGSAATEDDHVFVSVDAVRRWAGDALGGIDDGWESGFGAMVGYATSKGWMSDDGSSIKAHIEAG